MRVFLSYSREDQARIGQVRADLEELGHDVWLDARLSGGNEWWTAILGRIRASDVLVLCVTAASLESEACLAELRYARAVHRLVVPVALDDGLDPALAPMPLPHLQWVPYQRADKADVIALVRALAEGAPEALPDPLPTAPPVPGSYLTTLSARIRSPDVLDLGGQLVVLHQIEVGLDRARLRPALAALLDEFRRRHDLLADVLPKLELLRMQLAPDRGDGSPVATTAAPRRSRPEEQGRTGSALGRTGPPGQEPAVDTGQARPEEPAGADRPTLEQPGQPPRRPNRLPPGARRSRVPRTATPSVVDAIKEIVSAAELKSNRLHVEPDIPAGHREKITAKANLEEGEVLVAIFDLSVWGTGGRYFAFTDRRVLHDLVPHGWRYDAIAPGDVTAKDGGRGDVFIHSVRLYFNYDEPTKLVRLLSSIVEKVRDPAS